MKALAVSAIAGVIVIAGALFLFPGFLLDADNLLQPSPPAQEIGDFEIIVPMNDLTFVSNEVGSFALSIRSLQGFDSSVRLRVQDPPIGIRIDFDGGPEYRVKSGQTLDATISFTPVEDDAIGRRNITITATSQTRTHSIRATLDIIGQGTILLTVMDFTFVPEHFTVLRGTTVRWNNQDDADHTVTSKEDFFDIPLNRHSVASFQFTEEGTFNYFCRPHPWMLGTIEVIS